MRRSRSRPIKPRRLQEIGSALKAPLADGQRAVGSPAFVSDFLATDDGLALFRALIRLPDGNVRRDIVALIKEIVDNA